MTDIVNVSMFLPNFICVCKKGITSMEFYVCGGCGLKYYCSMICKQLDQSNHMKRCKEISTCNKAIDSLFRKFDLKYFTDCYKKLLENGCNKYKFLAANTGIHISSDKSVKTIEHSLLYCISDINLLSKVYGADYQNLERLLCEQNDTKFPFIFKINDLLIMKMITI